MSFPGCRLDGQSVIMAGEAPFWLPSEIGPYGRKLPGDLWATRQAGDYSLAIQTRHFKRIISEKEFRQSEALEFAGP